MITHIKTLYQMLTQDIFMALLYYTHSLKNLSASCLSPICLLVQKMSLTFQSRVEGKKKANLKSPIQQTFFKLKTLVDSASNT